MDQGTFAETTAWAWIVLLAGPVIGLIVFAIARRRRNNKWAWGASAIVLLIWFVVTAEWLPPPWREFWSTHSIAAGLVASLLAVVAGWFFISDEIANRRTAALFTTWREWTTYQCRFVEDILKIDRPTPDVAVLAQQVMAAGVSARLLIQQQWIAALFVISAVRSDEHGAELITRLAEIRDEGTFATRMFAQAESFLDSVDDEHLEPEAIKAIWDPALGSLRQLLKTLKALNASLSEAQWSAQEMTSEKPTHIAVPDINDLPRQSKPWSGN
jgi:hypothetical protein